MHHAMEHDSIGFNDTALIWSPRDKSNKLWLHCGQSSHLYKDCPNKKPRSAPKVVSDKWQSTYNRFQPAGHKRAASRSKSRNRGAPLRQGVSYALPYNLVQWRVVLCMIIWKSFHLSLILILTLVLRLSVWFQLILPLTLIT